MAKILVTGGTGEIGKVLIPSMLQDGYSVIVITRKRSSRAAKKLAKMGCSIYQGDIRDPTSLMDLPCVEGVFHLAGLTKWEADEEALWQTNVEGTKTLLEWSAKTGVRKFVFASSIEAVGRLKLEDVPTNEDCPCSPIDPYGESKLAAERLVRQYCQDNAITTTIARIGGVYTDHSHSKNKHIDRWIISFMAGYESEAKSQFKKRYIHLIHLSDVIRGLKLLYENARSNDKTFFLVGNEYATDEEIFHLVGFFMGYDNYLEGNLEAHPATEGAVHQAFSIERIKRDLGYSPLISLKDGVARKVAWYQSKGSLFKCKEVAKARAKNRLRSLKPLMRRFGQQYVNRKTNR